MVSRNSNGISKITAGGSLFRRKETAQLALAPIDCFEKGVPGQYLTHAMNFKASHSRIAQDRRQQQPFKSLDCAQPCALRLFLKE